MTAFWMNQNKMNVVDIRRQKMPSMIYEAIRLSFGNVTPFEGM